MTTSPEKKTTSREGSTYTPPARKGFFRRRKTCPFTGPEAPKIDYLDVKLLQRYVTERGRIMPPRVTGVNAKQQRKLSLAIKRARYLALLPYSVV